MSVVDEQGVLADVGHVDHSQLPVGAHHYAVLPVGAEANRFAVLQVDEHLSRQRPVT